MSIKVRRSDMDDDESEEHKASKVVLTVLSCLIFVALMGFARY